MKTFHALTPRAALLAALIAAAAAFATGVAVPALAADREDRQREVLALKDARLKIEFNATDRDAGVQLFVDSEPWSSLDVYDTGGRLMLRATARGRFALQGGTELFMESGEPSLDEVPLDVFLNRFPAGQYKIVANGIDGLTYVGHANFTHNIPDGPVLVAPAQDEVVNPHHLTVRWQAVVKGGGLVTGDFHFSQGDGEITFCGAIEMGGWIDLGVDLIKRGCEMYGITQAMFQPGPVEPNYSEFLVFEGISVEDDGTQRYNDVTLAYRRACLHAINYLKNFGYSGEQVYTILSTAPVEGRVSGVVDIPNACVSLYIPTAIFDFDIRPNAHGPKKHVTAGKDLARAS